jgi:hypothetical protein
MRIDRLFAAVGGIVLAGACGREASTTMEPNGACSAFAPIAVAVTVRDSVSGRALADSAMGTAQLGTVTDTLMHADSLTLWGGRQTGIYDVAVQRPGYRTWARHAVAVTQTGTCGNPVTVKLTAALQLLP